MKNLKNPKISIIMGAYNCASTVAKSIESIINQTFRDWEFIICDDCSSDTTIDILLEYSQKDDRIVVLRHKENLKLAATLNNCLEVSRGEFIARMDADDESLPQRLEIEINFLEAHPEYDLCGTNVLVYDGKNIFGERRFKEKPLIKDLVNGAPFAHPSIMIRKKVLLSLDGYKVSKDTARAEDLDLWFRLYSKGYKGANIQAPLYLYREGINDFKRRSFKSALQISRVMKSGYSLIGIRGFSRLKALKPVISSLLPKRLVAHFARKKLKKQQ